MNKLNRKIEYALMALKYMSGKYAGQLTTVKEICASTQIPFDATSRMMQLMAQKGILKSEHGAHGGYLIVKDLSKISFLDVIEAVVGPVEVVRCTGDSDQDTCEFFATCNMSSPLKAFNEKLNEFYAQLTVADLIQVKESNKENTREGQVEIS